MDTEATFDPMVGELPGAFAALQQVAAAAELCADLPLWPLGTGHLEHTLGLIGWVRHHLEVMERRVVAEGLARGLPGERGSGPVDWVSGCLSEMVPGPGPGHGAQVVRLARAQDQEDFAELFARVAVAELSTAKADQIVRFVKEVAPVADEVSLAAVREVLIEGASDTRQVDEGGHLHRVPGVSERQLGVAIGRARRAVLPAKDLQEEEDRARRGRALYARAGGAGMTEYRWILDPEAAAVVDAALAALAGPRPGPDGAPDPRSPARRRADALLDVVTRGLSCPDETLPGAHQGQVVVTLRYEDLVEGVRGAGTTATGQVFSPGTVRRMACDADIIPVVLGGPSEPLDVGRTQRLFTPAQRKALWIRDGGCTFPGCTVPPQWTQAHHIVHWLFGGLTDLSNAALLCPGHHTYVHVHDLTATVTATGVTWHT